MWCCEVECGWREGGGEDGDDVNEERKEAVGTEWMRGSERRVGRRRVESSRMFG